MKSLTVENLIDLLKKLDKKSVVVLEGCDCANECVGFSVGEGAYENNTILRTGNGVFDMDDLEIVNRTETKK